MGCVRPARATGTNLIFADEVVEWVACSCDRCTGVSGMCGNVRYDVTGNRPVGGAREVPCDAGPVVATLIVLARRSGAGKCAGIADAERHSPV